MEKMWFRTILMTAVCLSMAACGKSKNSSSVPAPETSAPTNPAPTAQAPSDQKDQKDQKKDAQSGQADDSKKKETWSGGAQGSGQDKDRKGNAHDKNPGKPKVQEKNKSGGNSAEGGASGSGNQEATQSVSVDAEKMKTKASYYSGSAADSLRELLMLEQSQIQSESQKLKNLKLAYSIENAELKINSQTGLVQFNADIKGGKAISMQGVIRSGRLSAVLASSAKGASGEITCMDETSEMSATCQTSVVEIRQGSASTKIVFRRTAVHLTAEFPDQNCLSKECDSLYHFFRLSEKKIVDGNTLKSALMESFEVINGKSGFKVLIVSNENQVMKLAAPLANPALFPVLDTAVDRTLSAEDLVDTKTGTLRKTQLNEALNDVRLVSNDGNGNLRMLVKMKVNVEGKRDFFHLYLERQVRPVRVQAVQLN